MRKIIVRKIKSFLKGVKFSGKVFLLMLIPILLVVKLGWDSILPLIVYLQLLLIWAQTELGMWQTVLVTAQFEPSFNIEERGLFEPGRKAVYADIINLSQNPAYTLSIARVLDRNRQAIPPQMWPKSLEGKHISCLAPNQRAELYSIDPNDREKLLANGLSFEVFYFTRFGEIRTFHISFSKTHPLLLIHERIKRPGVLLNTLEEIIFRWRFYREFRELKK
jgi:hypothetical protein